MKKPKKLTLAELDIIASFLAWKRKDFIFHCDGFDQYSDEEVDAIIEKVCDLFWYNLKKSKSEYIHA